jgi:hypothetical protein
MEETMRPTTAFDDNVFGINALLHPGTICDHPKDVLAYPSLTISEKRAILASWASDASAIASCPSLRAPAGLKAPVNIDEILEALRTRGALPAAARSAIFCCTEIAQVTASTALVNSTSRGGPTSSVTIRRRIAGDISRQNCRRSPFHALGGHGNVPMLIALSLLNKARQAVLGLEAPTSGVGLVSRA